MESNDHVGALMREVLESVPGSPEAGHNRLRHIGLNYPVLLGSRDQKVFVAVFRHPLGAGEMAIIDLARAIRLTGRIDGEDDRNRLFP